MFLVPIYTSASALTLPAMSAQARVNPYCTTSFKKRESACLRVSWANPPVLLHPGIPVRTRAQRIPLYPATTPCPGLLQFSFTDERVKASSCVNQESVHRKGKEREDITQLLLDSRHRCLCNPSILSRLWNKSPAQAICCSLQTAPSAATTAKALLGNSAANPLCSPSASCIIPRLTNASGERVSSKPCRTSYALKSSQSIHTTLQSISEAAFTLLLLEATRFVSSLLTVPRVLGARLPLVLLGMRYVASLRLRRDFKLPGTNLHQFCLSLVAPDKEVRSHHNHRTQILL